MSVEPLKKINRKLDYMENRDKFLDYNKKWREKNKDKVKKYQAMQNKKYYQEHREELLAKYKARREQKAMELRALEDRWDKLKEWAGYLCYFELLDKMKELEKGE